MVSSIHYRGGGGSEVKAFYCTNFTLGPDIPLNKKKKKKKKKHKKFCSHALAQIWNITMLRLLMSDDRLKGWIRNIFLSPTRQVNYFIFVHARNPNAWIFNRTLYFNNNIQQLDTLCQFIPILRHIRLKLFFKERSFNTLHLCMSSLDLLVCIICPICA